MAAANSKSNSKKSMDIESPGKSTPDTTARPVIVGHKPMIKDPMMKEESAEDLTSAEKPELEPVIHSTKTIQPLKLEETAETDDTVAEQSVTPDTAEVEKEITSDTKIAEANIAKDSLPDGPAETEKTEETKIESSEAAEVDALAEQAEASKKDKNEPTEEEKKRQEQIQKLIAEKKYFVPIGQVTRRRKNRQALLLLFVLILSAAAGYYLHQKGYF